MKGLIHFHSDHSYDSVNKIEAITSFIQREYIDFLVLTDHETIKGSLELKAAIKEKNIKAIAPIAAEYKTDCGDLIAIFIKDEIKDMTAEGFIKEVHNQGGLVLIPHPYVGHKNLEKITSLVDAVEVYNPRCSDIENEKASKLAYKYSKPIYHGTDAHTLKEMSNAIITLNSVSNETELREALLDSKCISSNQKKSQSRLVFFSQMVRGFKTQNLRIIIKNALKILLLYIKGKRKKKV